MVEEMRVPSGEGKVVRWWKHQELITRLNFGFRGTRVYIGIHTKTDNRISG